MNKNKNTSIGLCANNLNKSFGKKNVLHDVSYQVKKGEVVGLLGPNGAGKTTSFYMITGLISPDAGNISLDGVDITEQPMYKRARLGVAYLPQDSSIFRGLTVEENIMSVLEVREPDPVKRETKLEELLAEFSISRLRKSQAMSLSGGERRRCEIARALASDPDFLLLDEPLTGIDPIAINDIRNLILHLKDRGLGILITDHNVRDTLDVVDRAYILYDGHVLKEGTPADIVEHDDVKEVYLGHRFSL